MKIENRYYMDPKTDKFQIGIFTLLFEKHQSLEINAVNSLTLSSLKYTTSNYCERKLFEMGIGLYQ